MTTDRNEFEDDAPEHPIAAGPDKGQVCVGDAVWTKFNQLVCPVCDGNLTYLIGAAIARETAAKLTAAIIAAPATSNRALRAAQAVQNIVNDEYWVAYHAVTTTEDTRDPSGRPRGDY